MNEAAGGGDGFSVRRAEARDGENIADLFVTVNRQLAPEGMTEAFEDYIALSLVEEIRPHLDYYSPERGNGLWVAHDGDDLVGMYGLEQVGPGTVELRRMYVHPSRRRQGMARRLLAHSQETAAREGYAKLVLSTSEIQEAAIALYENAGFRLVKSEAAEAKSNKTIGGGILRHHYEKML